jgi:hypothetical protein
MLNGRQEWRLYQSEGVVIASYGGHAFSVSKELKISTSDILPQSAGTK